MRGRLIVAITTTILEEAAIFAVGLWGLPKIGIRIPLWGIILIMIAWVVYGNITYRAGSRALNKENTIGLVSMIGTKGEVTSPLNPEGMVKVRGELWKARSESGDISSGEEVTVTGQERLALVVKKNSSMDRPS
jgi:membrane-bound ClpP family serine protease